jgi:pseudouridine-5'-monophosphatase
VLEPFGVEFTFEMKAAMMGKRAIEAAETLIAATPQLQGKLTPRQFVEARETILDELFPTSELMPGAEKVVKHLHSQKIKIAVATSSHRRHFNAKTQRHEAFFSRFAHITTGDQVERGKPHPDIFQKAAALFDEPPKDPRSVLVFEDAPSGVEAARAAGMRSVLVPDARLPEEQRKGACEVLRSLEEFDPRAWGLPGYEDE